jgi:2-amino-4-hydroxy-6-hydroxymethyldihydropteridine diphosphokinase
MPHCWIALGGNLGDVRSAMERALVSLAERGLSVVRRSRFYDTTPVGSAAGTRYLNAAAELETDLAPNDVLSALQAVETAAGRVRSVHWGPRPLDLDLLLYDQQQIRTPQLTVPHPALWYRRFVLDPLVEIAADAPHPGLGVSIANLYARLCQRPLPVSIELEDAGRRTEVAEVCRQFGGRVQLVADSPPAAVVFRSVGREDGRLRTIEIPASGDAASIAQDVLTAALDEPVPLD